MFNFLLYRPLLNLLVWISESLVSGDFGLAIIILTIIVRTLLFPLFHKFLKNQQAMIKIQAEQKKIEAQYPGDKNKQLAEIMQLYKENKINPFSSIWLMFAQIPVILALYKVINTGINGAISPSLYSWVHQTTAVNYIFLGLINLKARNTIMFVLTLAAQFLQGMLSAPGGLFGKASPELQASRKASINTNLIMVALLSLFFWSMPAAIGLYWLISSLFSIVQQMIINKFKEGNGELKRNN
jgi:YidC/Oxa1 family membrane protein insertase